MKPQEIEYGLAQLKLWRDTGGEEGCNNYFRGKDLRYADLVNADLGYANLRYADLGYANLRRANLRYADLVNAHLDFSCFPLWCGSIGWTVDDKLPRMLAAFICSMKCDDEEIKEMQELIRPYAEKSHRAKDILG